jgi:2-oxoglutarate dehydrogenase E2 component (dihydrolipoamide succinyltransferase)
MAIEIKMPQLGESVVEGTVSKWLKQPGDRVEEYEALLEVMTDKVDTEVPSPQAGVLREIKVPEGETVRVGTLLALLDDGRQPASVEPQAVVASQSSGVSNVEHKSSNAFISPVVARLAAEHNLDLSRLQGSGAGSRVTKQDVLRYLDESRRVKDGNLTGSGASVGNAVPAVPPGVIPPTPPLPSQASAPGSAATNLINMPSGPLELPEDAELVPISPMRRLIAEHMARSVRTAPHVTTVAEVDLGRIVAHRERHKADFERQGVKLTFTPYFVQAVVVGLRATPIFNGSYTDQGIVIHQRMHIGVAVALDEGLIVPVIRDADEKNLLGLARMVNDLSARARSRRLKPDETQGGTFTVTNHGVSGSLFATPIINQPQSGILGVGAIQKRAVVITQAGVDAIAIRPMCYLSLTFDHRIADGATADAFLIGVKTALESFAEE